MTGVDQARHDLPGSVELPTTSSIEPHAAANGLHHRSVTSTAAGTAAEGAGDRADVEAQVSSTAAPSKNAAGEEEENYDFKDVTWMDIVKQFSILGWTAFGGPAAHIGLMQRVGII
jgi:chromate transporter